MKFKSLALSLFLATPAFAGPYELISVPHSEVDSYLTIGSEATGTPEALQGLWWLDGNPLPDEVISFAGTKWEETIEDGEVVGYASTINVYDEKIWTWHDSKAGRNLYNGALATKLVYNLRFNLDFTYGEITPTIKPVFFIPSAEIPNSPLLDFTISKVNDNEYSRVSHLLGLNNTYRFRRIVDAQGNRLPEFDEFLKKVEVPNALLPICKVGDGESIPSACVR